jgi:hypothetical protein
MLLLPLSLFSQVGTQGCLLITTNKLFYGCESQTCEMDNDRIQEPHQDVQDKEKDESSKSICHEDYHPI